MVESVPQRSALVAAEHYEAQSTKSKTNSKKEYRRFNDISEGWHQKCTPVHSILESMNIDCFQDEQERLRVSTITNSPLILSGRS